MNMQFIDNLIVIKEHYKLSLEEMSKYFGEGKSTQSNYLKGQTIPDVQYLLNVCKYCGLDPNTLCFKKISKIDIPDIPYSDFKKLEEPSVIYKKLEKEEKPLIDMSGLEERLARIEQQIEKLNKK